MSKRVKGKEYGTPLLVSTLRKKGIKLVAIDFDQTLINFHTGGIWKENTDKLAASVRPCIRDLIDLCFEGNISICIVTYFSQPWVIKEMLVKVFGRSNTDKILIQANTPQFREKHNHEFLGKEAHISEVITELYNKSHLKIRPEEIILFDDDKENTDIAIKFGHMAFLVGEDVSEQSFSEFAKTLESAELRKSWVK